MTAAQGRKAARCMGLTVALLPTLAGVPGCGNPGEGTVTVSPEVRAKFARGPELPPTERSRRAPERPGIMSRLREGTNAK